MTASPPPSLPAAVRDYGDPAAEYAALRAGALLVDRSRRDRWTFRGPKAKETVTGLVTNDIVGVAPGLGCYAAALTAKGRVVADLRVFALAEPAAGVGTAPPSWLDGATLLVDAPDAAAPGWEAIVRKYVNPRVAPYRREGERLRAIGVYGVRAREAVAAALGIAAPALGQLVPYGHATVETDEGPTLVVRVPDLGLDGFELVFGAEAWDATWARLAGAAPWVVAGGQQAYDVARIEAGTPAWGLDMDETTIPQEANFDELHAISYTKGCYTGQEVVARVHFRGHVNRHLRGLAYPGDGGPLPRGAELVDETGKVVGDVRSAAVSPRLGGVAIGMVRREVALGALLVARWPADEATERPAGERGVTVSVLPFPL